MNAHEVEVYAQTNDAAAVVRALSQVVGTLAADGDAGEGFAFHVAGNVVVMLHRTQPGYLGVMVRGSDAWPSSPALGRFLAAALRCVVRCDPEHEYPEVSPYSVVFLEIDGDGERLITWE